MVSYVLTVPENADEQVAVTCTDHDVTERYPAGTATLSFYCPDCDVELDVDRHDAADWRDWGERC